MNNKGLGTLICWFFSDYIIKKVLEDQLFPLNLSLCFDFVIFLTMFLKGLDFCQFQVRRIENCGELEEELGEQIRLWYTVYMYESLRKSFLKSKKKNNKRNDNVFSRIKCVSYFILLRLCGVFVGYCLFVHMLIFLLNSLLISCCFGVREWHILSPFQMAVQVSNQTVSIWSPSMT